MVEGFLGWITAGSGFPRVAPKEGEKKNAYPFHVRKILTSTAPVSLLKSFGPAGVSICATIYGGLFFCNG